MEATLHAVVLPQGMPPPTWMAQYALGLSREGSESALRSDRTSASHLMGKAADRTPRNGRHCLQQMPGLWIAMQSPCDLADSFGQSRCRSGDGARYLRQESPGERRCRSGYNREQLAGGHSDQGQEMFRCFLFGFGLGRQFSEVLHHGIGIDLTDGADFVLVLELVLMLMLMLVLVLHLFFHFFFAEQASDHIADGAEPAFAFQAGFVLHLFFHLFLEFVLVLVLMFVLGKGFQLSFELISHDDSSCEMRSNSAGPVFELTNGTAAHPGSEAAARPLESPADPHIALNGGGASARAAQHTPDLLGCGASCASPRDGNSACRLPFQVSHGAAHDSGYCPDDGPGNSAATQDARQDRGAAHQVRKDPPQRPAVGGRDHRHHRRACHGFGFSFMGLLRSGLGHHLGYRFIVRQLMGGNLMGHLVLALVFEFLFHFLFVLVFAEQ
jgi:hypothetical protein